mgnify:CR=1 FL=1
MPGAVQNGWFAGRGSARKTSRMAPARWPEAVAAIRSASTIRAPRPKLSSQAPGFIRASMAALCERPPLRQMNITGASLSAFSTSSVSAFAVPVVVVVVVGEEVDDDDDESLK